MVLMQVRFAVRDFVVAFRFYRDVLGLAPQVDDERGPYAKFTLPEGDAAIAIQTGQSLEDALGIPLELGVGAVVAIRVADVDAVFAEVRARGGEFLREPRELWGRMRVAHLRDPDGNLIELQQWL